MTSSLLPVLREHTPEMQLCSVCPKPGACCSHFHLRESGELKTFWIENAFVDAHSWLESLGLPFKPEPGLAGCWEDETGHKYATFWYSCPELTADGRCGIYETRPELCRYYQPESDALCVFGKSGTQ